MSEAGSALVARDAAELFLPERLDLALKALCFATDWAPRPRRLYVRHIAARALESRDRREPARRLADARRVFAGLARVGFDSRHPVPIARGSDRILDGAHRVAACAVLGVPVLCRLTDRIPRRLEWGRAWFAAHGFSDDDIRWLERERQRRPATPGERMSFGWCGR